MPSLRPAIGARALLRSEGERRFAKPRSVEPFTGDPGADGLLNDLEHFPHAFVLACVMDRQIPAEQAWRIPQELRLRLGSFCFAVLRDLSLQRTEALFLKPTPLHRFNQVMAKAWFEAVHLIARRYEGDASRIWAQRPSSASVVLRFLEFDGVGPKIATMAANLLARVFKIEMSDYYSIDISVDVHVKRVLERLEITRPGASDEEVIYAARAASPEFPGLLDSPAWEIGRRWCRPQAPRCSECYMNSSCPTAGGAASGGR